MNGLKSGKDRTQNPRFCFVCFCTRTNSLIRIHTATEPPAGIAAALTRSGRLLFAIQNESLIFANLITLVTASSDLTSLQTLSTTLIKEGPFIKGT